MDKALLQTILPLAIIAVVFVLRFRNLSKRVRCDRQDCG